MTRLFLTCSPKWALKVEKTSVSFREKSRTFVQRPMVAQRAFRRSKSFSTHCHSIEWCEGCERRPSVAAWTPVDVQVFALWPGFPQRPHVTVRRCACSIADLIRLTFGRPLPRRTAGCCSPSSSSVFVTFLSCPDKTLPSFSTTDSYRF